MFVVYHMAFDKEKDISTYSSGYGGGYGAYGWGWGGGGWAGGTTSTQVRDILVGTLVIDMADAKKGQLVWRGHGREGSEHVGQPREARQEHQQGDREDLQELSAEEEELGRPNMGGHLVAAIVLAMAGSAGAQTPAPAAPQQDTSLNLSAYAELLRSDVRTLKVAIITEVMGFTEAEDDAFWPIYREYDLEMSKLADERLAMIRDYAAAFGTLTDERAASLAAKALDLESRRHAAKAKCYERVKTALSPRTALRFLQVEHQLQLLIDLQIAAALPVAPPVKDRP